MQIYRIFEALFEHCSGDKRPSWNEYFLYLATVIALRSTCNVIATGAIITKNNKIISTGYTGAPSGFEHCCTRGDCWKDHEDVKDCLGVHAAVNAILYGAGEDLKGSTIYLAGYDLDKKCLVNAKPCGHCMGIIKNVGIENIITVETEGTEYPSECV